MLPEAAAVKSSSLLVVLIVMVVCGCERGGWAISLLLLSVVTIRYNNHN